MSSFNLDPIFQPASIAVVGATERKGNVGSAIMFNLINGGYRGEIYPINPNHDTIWGKTAYGSISRLNSRPDLAVIATPIKTVPGVVRQCVDHGVGGAVIISAGGKETGDKGRETEAAIKEQAGDAGFRIIGPNCLGIINVRHNLNASFAAHMPNRGKMAFISQSGAICTTILDLSIKEQMGFSYMVSLGSMLDVDFGDIIDYLGGEADVSSIVMYIENLSRIRNFMSAARAVSRIKPIIALKAGRSRAGAKAAASHTGALAGEDAVYDAAFKRAGIVRVRTFEELFDCAELLSKHSRSLGPGLAIITNAGGPGVMAADALSDYGEEPVTLSPQTISKLDEFLPAHWSRSNPIDIVGDASPERYEKAVRTCLEAPEIKGLLIMLAPQALTDPTEVAMSLTRVLSGKKMPVFTNWIGGRDVDGGREIFNRAQIPTFDTPERAVRAFMDLCRYGQNIELLQQIPSNLPGKLEFSRDEANRVIEEHLRRDACLMTEIEAKRLLSCYGIPITPTHLAVSAEEAVRKSIETGFPVAMKVHSETITHKSDVGGVRLNLKTENDVKEAYTAIISACKTAFPEAQISGVTVQSMIQDPDYELILGAKMDADFGPVILFGMGGITTEIIKDKSLALPPLNRLLARRLIEETMVYQLLKGYRHLPAVDLTILEEILVRLTQLVTDFSEIAELDINPLLIKHNRAIGVDARVVLTPNPVKSPFHLVISPYPKQHEEHTVCKTGEKIFIRPIRPEDARLLVEHFDSLSPRTVYRRFFSPLKQLSHAMLVKFTQLDYDREIALVALWEQNGHEEFIGVARIVNEANMKEAEFSVVISDGWQGKGIGAGLLSRCLKIAKSHGIQWVMGMVLAENTQMLALGKKLGFKMSSIPKEGTYELHIDLATLSA